MKKKEMCVLYPLPEEETCVCAAGADISGTQNDAWICSDEYSENCPWAREWEIEMEMKLRGLGQ